MAIFGFMKRLFRNAGAIDTAYSVLTAQARHPWFFASQGVPDSLEGRFECIVLHLAVVHLAMEAPTTLHPQRQKLVERFVADMDSQMREIGVSDSGIARKMTKMAEHLYGRIRAYKGGLQGSQGGQGEMAAAVATNLGIDSAQQADAIARYAITAFRAMESTQNKTKDLAWCTWPDPSSSAAAAAA